MLHRSFKPAKCKTSLKLATSRIKLMKNKKEVQLKQLKRDLAQLLESGQDQTARIRVEHVVREQKMIAAYDLIDVYCEIIVARLPIIESQKTCPVDLKEAIASVIFASPRCADLSELTDVRKHFTAKYGKEFVSAAIELLPDCGVNRILVEKLSARAPDGQTKIKILTAIAEEHNIKWDPKSFGEKDSKPPDDLLNGPDTFEKASKMHVEPPNVQAPRGHDQKRDPPVNSFEQKLKSPPTNFTSTITGDTEPKMPTSYDSPEVSTSGTRAERPEYRQSFSGDIKTFSSERQNWTMEFKDATSAAHAAAESAERASMAARAAAELSSRGEINRQYSTESQRSNAHGMGDDGPREYAALKLRSEHIARDPENNYSYERNPKSENEHIDRTEHDNSTRRSSRSASLRSSQASIDDDTLVNSLEKGYSQTNLSKEQAVKANESGLFTESMKKKSGESEVKVVNGRQDGLKSKNYDYSVEERITKRSSTTSSRSHSRTFNGDEDLYVGANQGNSYRETLQKGSHDDNTVYDRSGSAADDYKFDMGPKYDDQESKLYFPSPGRKSPSRVSPHADSLNRRGGTIGSFEKSSSQSPFSTERRSSPEFSESLSKSAVPSKSDDLFPVTYDHSDSPNSESEDELDKSRCPQKQNLYPRNSEPTQRESPVLTGSSFSAKKENLGFERNTYLHSPSNDSDSVKVWPKNDIGKDMNASHQKRQSRVDLNNVGNKSSFDSPVDEENSVSTTQSRETDRENEMLERGSSESGNELDFGTLTGGRRDKGYKYPPYTTTPSGDSSSSFKKVAKDKQPNTLSPLKSSTSSGASTKAIRKSSARAPIKHYDSSSDSDFDSDSDSDSDSEEEVPQKKISSKQEPPNRKAVKEVNTKSSLKGFDYINDDSEEDVLKQNFDSRVRLGSGFSRRTKTSPSTSETISYSKVTTGSHTLGNSNSGAERKQSRSSYGTETTRKPSSQSAGSNPSGITEFGAKSDHSRTSSGSENPRKLKSQSAGSNPSGNSEFGAKSYHSGTPYGTETPLKPEYQSAGSNPSGITENGAKRIQSRTSSGIETPSKFESHGAGSNPSGNSEFGVKSNNSRTPYGTETPRKPESQSAGSNSSGNTDFGAKRNQSRTSYGTETPRRTEPHSAGSNTSGDSETGPERSHSRISYGNETPRKPESRRSGSGYWGGYEQSNSLKLAASKPLLESKSQTTERPPSPPRGPVKSSSMESPRSSSLSSHIPSRESSLKKASHVHPKLPDYDTIAAQLQAMRTNRQ